MPVYTYTALNERGKSIKGIISADSARQGRNKLRQFHFYLTSHEYRLARTRPD